MLHKLISYLMMKYSIEKLSQQEVLDLLKTCNNSFTPSLTNNIPFTLEEYAERLSTHANFVLAEEYEIIAGFLAYYTNIEEGFAYIPQVWVSDNQQRKGIGGKMLNVLIQNMPASLSSVRLEVRKNNDKAVSFYNKMGFKVLENSGRKILLAKNVK
jgi:ribosomal protein S18 acetylase RimI-like enzyme